MRCGFLFLAASVMGLCCSGAAAEARAGPTTRSAEQVEALIRGLKGDDWQVRQKAQDRLVQIGPSVLSDLRNLLRSTADDEIRARAESAIRQIELNYAQFLQFEFTPNADVIAERHAAPGDPGATSGIDIGGCCFLSASEAKFRGRGKGQGLPDDGQIGDVRLLPYDQNNVARRADDKPIVVRLPAGRYSTVTFYACTGSDTNTAIPGASVTATLTYSTGQPTRNTFTVPDWALRPAGIKMLIDHADRTLWTPRAILAMGWEHRTADWGIFSLPVAADPNRELTSVSLARTGNRGVVNLFAAGGKAVADPANAPYAAALKASAVTRPAVPPKRATKRLVQFKFKADADVVIGEDEEEIDVSRGMDATGAMFLSESESIAATKIGGLGLPDDGRIDDVQLLPYDQKNVARRADDTPISIQVLPGRYESVTFHGCAGREAAAEITGAAMTATLTYATGEPEVLRFVMPESFQQPPGGTFLITNLARVAKANGNRLGIQLRLPGWSIFSCTVRADPGRQLTGISLIRTGREGIVSLFAASGTSVPEAQKR